MAVLRNKLVNNFTMIPTSLILDSRISHGCCRQLCYAFSRPDGWIINNTDIQKKLKIKRRETIAKYWREAIEANWISRKKRPAKKGRYGGYDYELKLGISSQEDPCTVAPCTENAIVRKNRTLINTDVYSDTYIEQQHQISPQEYHPVVVQFINFFRTRYPPHLTKTKNALTMYQSWLSAGIDIDIVRAAIDASNKRGWIPRTPQGYLQAVINFKQQGNSKDVTPPKYKTRRSSGQAIEDQINLLQQCETKSIN